MKITNRYNLPDSIVRAVTNDLYSKGDCDFSVTELLLPPQIYALRKKYANEIEEDVSDRIWSLLGQGMHAALERANLKGIAERRLVMEVGPYKISGGMDLYEENGVLTDYKMTSTFKIKTRDYDDYIFQLSAYAAILEYHGHVVNGIRVIAFLRDWMKRDVGKAGYPECQVATIDLPRISMPKMLELMLARANALAATDKQEMYRACSPNERWANPKSYGKRCEDYCSISRAGKCDQYNKYLRNGDA